MPRMMDNSAAENGQEMNRFRWLTTFNDMITLLMVFFVLLFAMGSMDVRRFKHFQNALQSAMGVMNPGKHAPIGIISKDESSPAIPAESYGVNGNKSLEQLVKTEGLEAEYTRKGIQLILDDNLLFNSGSALLNRKGIAMLERVAKIIAPLNRVVRVEGHTDNIPIANGIYPSNWELSTARAVNVVKYLHQNGNIPARNLQAAGYGSSRPRVLNDSEQNRSINRRVEIILKQQVASHVEK